MAELGSPPGLHVISGIYATCKTTQPGVDHPNEPDPEGPQVDKYIADFVVVAGVGLGIDPLFRPGQPAVH